jgi:hypothetical protein
VLDTLKLSVWPYDISPDANLDVQPPSFNTATGEVRGRYRLFRRGVGFVEGAKAFHNADDFQVTVKPLSHSDADAIGCYVEFSVPRLANGSNFEPADFAATEQALVTIERELRSIGINTNIETATISRLDSCKNVLTREPFPAYAPVLASLPGSRTAKRDYGTTFLWHNTVQQFCVYDKREEMKHKKRNVTLLPKNVVRFEHRLTKGRKVRDVLGFGTAADLLIGFDEVKKAYVTAMQKQLFRLSPAQLESAITSDWETQLIHLIGHSSNSEMSSSVIDDLLRARGWPQVQADGDALFAAVEKFCPNRMSEHRIKKKMNQAKANAMALQQIAPSKHTLGELYRELEREVLSL